MPRSRIARSGQSGSGTDRITSDNISTVSYITSASLLSKRQEFQQWAIVVGLDIDIKSSIPSSQTFRQLRDLKDLSNRFPAWLADTDSAQYLFIPTRLRNATNEISTVLGSRRLADPTLFPDDVELELASLHIILITCRHMQLLGIHSRKPTEADRRYLLDALLGHICEIDSNDTSVRYSAEQELKLPEVQLENCNVNKTKADGVMYLDVPDFRPYRAHPEMEVAATAFCIEAPVNFLQVIHCAAEFKRDQDGSNQAMMAMVSGLYQRRVLRMPEQFVFGVLHFQGVYFKVVAGLWQENKIQLYEIGRYSMEDPIQAIQFYLVLRGIHRLGGSYLEKIRESAQSLMSQIRESPPPTTWYPVRMGSIMENPNQSNQQPPHQGGANTQQAHEQHHIRQKVESYLKTTSSSEFLPVDLPPTPPIDPPSSPTVNPATSPSIGPDLGHGSDSSSDESDTPHNLPLFVPVTSQGHKIYSTIDPLGLMGRIQSEDL